MIHKELWIKSNEKLNKEDKRRIKYILKEIKIRLWEINKNKWEQGQGGNNIYGWLVFDPKLGKVIEKTKRYDIVDKIIWELTNRKADLLWEKTIKAVEKFLNKYVRSEKFRKDFNIPEEIKIREDEIVRILLSEYVETAKITERISKERIPDIEKINKLKEELKNNWLEHMVEVIDKVMKMRERWIKPVDNF